jgi:hypothetical protein
MIKLVKQNEVNLSQPIKLLMQVMHAIRFNKFFTT